jgi:hypothetical protein
VPLRIRAVAVLAPAQRRILFRQHLGDVVGGKAGTGYDAGDLQQRRRPVDRAVGSPFDLLATT